MKILIVEDHPEDRKFMKYNIEAHGCEAIEAGDGEEGFAKASAHMPDVIISDALMPKMDGFQLLRKLKQDERLKHIPFFFYSAVYTGYKEEELAISLGAEAFIVKPKEPQELWDEMLKILGECGQLKVQRAASVTIKDEEDFLEKYSQIVAAKLEEKVQELEREIIERKSVQAKLQERTNFLFNIINSIRDGISILDRDLNILETNPTMEKWYAHQMPLAGKKCYEAYHGRTAPCIPCPTLRTIESGRPETGLVQFVGDNDEVKGWFELFTFPFIDSVTHMHTGIIEYVRDVTEHKSMEEQLRQAQKMEAVGTLAGGVAHDFNNILSAIIGYGYIIHNRLQEDDPLRTFTSHILESAERATHLTQSLLSFSRKQVVNLRPVRLNELIKNFEKFLLRLVREDIELRTVCPNRELVIMADSGQIEQVLMNLVTNARDAIEGVGTIIISTDIAEMDEAFVKLHGFGAAGGYALITVTDSGKGMEKKTSERIFEPFFTTKEMGKGTGLGLAIVYGLIRQHDGYINVYSEPGKGTTFRIYMPLLNQAAGSPVKREHSLKDIKGGTETILFAEDDADTRRLYLTLLKQSGYDIIEAENGEEAVVKFSEHQGRIRLVILDMIMPKKNGREVYEEIRKMKDGVKVIFVSGYAGDLTKQKELIDAGIPFLMKPSSPEILLRTIRETLDK